MALITWQTSAGSLGNYPAGSTIDLQFSATSDDTSSIVTYQLLSGSLPSGTRENPVELNRNGQLTGVFARVFSTETYSFTIRAFDQYGSIRDRTFSIVIEVASIPKFVSPPGKLVITYDSVWIDFQVQYDNPVTDNEVTITKSSGELPPGMYVTTSGKLRGYPEPPKLSNGSPITKIYNFTLQLESMLGNDSVQYSIEVVNQTLLKPPNNRTPAILNSRPPSNNLDDDPFFAYYLPEDNVIPTTIANNFFTFKVIGKDFDGDTLRYNFSSLPPGLTGDSETGWITGSPIMYSAGINDYVISVSVSKLSKPLLVTPTESFHLRVVFGVTEDIVWKTPENLGTIYNNTISELVLSATSAKTLVYSLYSGKLPANLTVENSGNISGRVAFQPADFVMRENQEHDFVFTVQAYAAEFPAIKSFKTFTLTVKQYYSQPVENVYFKIAPSINGREILDSLLTNTSLIPTEYLYRTDDLYFGKSSNIKIIQAYGVVSSSLQTYLSAIQKNHYNRNIVLGNLKTAVARDSNGDLLYEVVYSEVVDDLENNEGVSIPKEITWPTPINLNLGPWTANDTDLYASYTDYYTSLTPGYIDKLYPASLANMREVLVENIGQNKDINLFPKWMTSQQEDGNTLGFVKCWVICYTLPGKSAIIKNNIETLWNHSLNQIDCSIDRYVIDKTSTYNWNTNLEIPVWNEIPSETPNYDNPEEHDLMVLFDRKTILPKE